MACLILTARNRVQNGHEKLNYDCFWAKIMQQVYGMTSLGEEI